MALDCSQLFMKSLSLVLGCSPVNTGDGTADGDGGIVIKVEEEVSGIRKAHSSENMDILCSPTTTTR